MPPNAREREDSGPLGPAGVGLIAPALEAIPAPPPPPAPNRVPQACVACRRKKVKCDGNNPCSGCHVREQSCEYPGTRDNASTSRNYAASFEARCQQMDLLCQRLEGLTGQLAQSLAKLDHTGYMHPDGMNDGEAAELLQTAHVLRSMNVAVPPQCDIPHDAGNGPENEGRIADHGAIPHQQDVADVDDDDDDSLSDEDQNDDDTGRVGMLVRDSYGRLRFMGGATNQMLIDAVKSLSPGGGHASVSSTPNAAGVTGAGAGPGTQANGADLEVPLFIHGSVWPDLPYLPKPDQLARPPKYVADLLVNLYFDQLHYTFPVLFRPHFMQRYRQMLRPVVTETRAGPASASSAAADPNTAQSSSSSSSIAADRRFLMVFFAVCACASGLLPGSTDRRFAGIEHYEKALLLCHAAAGEASLERVQCLALLAMCTAGWNTLTQSWMLAGQAVRAAQDIGIHLSRPLIASPPNAPEAGNRQGVLRQQIACRVWWSIYNLDRVISICLGRPMATSDEDCDCDLPLDMSDEQLGAYARDPRPHPNSSSAMAGFIAFSRLCRIAGKIQQLHSPKHLRALASNHADKRSRFLARVAAYDKSLAAWVEGLPDEIRFSANALGNGPNESMDLTMCVIIFIVHAGSLLNLYRGLAGHPNYAMLSPEETGRRAEAVSQCISAAKSCINAAELVRDLVPPSHHLAFCIYYLTLSGIVLLRMPTIQDGTEVREDVGKCIQLLTDLEPLWSGAARGKAIVSQLLAEYNAKKAAAQALRAAGDSDDTTSQGDENGRKRNFREFLFDDEGDGLLWHQIPGSELLSLELPDLYTLG